MRLVLSPTNLLLKPVQPRLHLRGDDDGLSRFVENQIDEATGWPRNGNLDRTSPGRRDGSNQPLDDSRLDPIAQSRSRAGVDTNGQVPAERRGQRRQDCDARLARSGQHLTYVRLAHIRFACKAVIDIPASRRCRSMSPTTLEVSSRARRPFAVLRLLRVMTGDAADCTPQVKGERLVGWLGTAYPPLDGSDIAGSDGFRVELGQQGRTSLPWTPPLRIHRCEQSVRPRRPSTKVFEAPSCRARSLPGIGKAIEGFGVAPRTV